MDSMARLADLSPHQFLVPEIQSAQRLISLGLEEDLGPRGDLTTQLMVSANQQGDVALKARQAGVVCGLPLAWLVLAAVDPELQLTPIRRDGDSVQAGETLATIHGPLGSLLTAERTVLNFLTHLCGIASLTRKFVDRVAEFPAKILDTRKTHPGYRLLEKYAVRCGGGTNHRIGLYDGVMVKDNHLAAYRHFHPEKSLAELVTQIRQTYPDVPITVEVDTLEQLTQYLPGQPDIVLLDNMSLETMRSAVSLRNQQSPQTLLEASGGVNWETVYDIASTGVDRISIGALTHSAPACDIGFDWLEKTELTP